MKEKKIQHVWDEFARTHHLSEGQQEQFKGYFKLLLERSEQMNLTTIVEPSAVIRDHFQDALSLAKCVDLTKLHSLADVGSGGGIPGIPLKIAYPHLSIVLIETNNKKADFLEEVIKRLHLSSIEVCRLDWRNFLRQTTYDIDLFVARASLRPDELLYMFKPACRYRQARLVYFASAHWALHDREAPFYQGDYNYMVGHKQRRFILFSSASVPKE